MSRNPVYTPKDEEAMPDGEAGLVDRHSVDSRALVRSTKCGFRRDGPVPTLVFLLEP